MTNINVKFDKQQLVGNEQGVLGVDFGTSNTCISYYDYFQRAVIVVTNSSGDSITPSCFYVDTENGILIGKVAQWIGRRSPRNRISNFKRLLGLSWAQYLSNTELQRFFMCQGTEVCQDPETDELLVNLNDKKYTIRQIITMYLTRVFDDIRERIPFQMKQVVITVPAYYTSLQRTIIGDIFTNLGMNVIKILNEPTAAALAYGHYNEMPKQCETVLVIDCGGGTTDVSLLEMDYMEQVYQVKSVSGENFLGGGDVTALLMDDMISKLGVVGRTDKLIHEIEKESERVKCELSYKTNSLFSLQMGESYFSLHIGRAKFIDIIQPFTKKVKNCVLEASLGYSVDKVVLVGGSCRLSVFQDICKDIFGPSITICKELELDQAVSIGAALYHHLNSPASTCDDTSVVLFDVLNITVGVEVEGGIMMPIITKNTPIPTDRSLTFSNCENNITSMTISVYQGERKLTKHCTLLANLTLGGLDPKLLRGEMIINVSFAIDSNGILTVCAEDWKTSQKSSVTIRAGGNGNDECDPDCDDMELILNDSILANKVHAKLELYHTMVELLAHFHTNQAAYNVSKQSFADLLLNELFNNALHVLLHYDAYKLDYINRVQKTLQVSYHKILVSGRSTGKSMSTKLV